MGTAILFLGITTAVVLSVIFFWAQISLYRMQMKSIKMLHTYLNRAFEEWNRLNQSEAEKTERSGE